jgi:hypothetical protein
MNILKRELYGELLSQRTEILAMARPKPNSFVGTTVE